MRRTIALAAAAAVCLLGALTARSAGPAPACTLGLHPAKGAALRFRAIRTSRADIDAYDLHRRRSFSREFTLKVSAVGEDGVIDGKVTFGRVHGAWWNTKESGFDFDSRKPDVLPEGENPKLLARAFMSYDGKSVEVRIDRNGKVLSVKGLREILRPVLGDRIEAMTDEEAVKDLQNLFPLIPSGRREPGADWHHDEVVEIAGSGMVWRLGHELSKVDGKTAKITLAMKPVREGAPEGSGKGTIDVSLSDGFVEAFSFELTMKTARGDGTSSALKKIERLR